MDSLPHRRSRALQMRGLEHLGGMDVDDHRDEEGAGGYSTPVIPSSQDSQDLPLFQAFLSPTGRTATPVGMKRRSPEHSDDMSGASHDVNALDMSNLISLLVALSCHCNTALSVRIYFIYSYRTAPVQTVQS